MQATNLSIDGVVVIRPKILGDARGYFMETFKDNWFRETVADVTFVQDNQARSAQAGTIRGLHYQLDPLPQGKLVRCLSGAIFDVAVDIRSASPTYGQWVSANLTSDGAEQLWIPEGFLHGYCTLTDEAEVFYKVTNPYSVQHDRGIAFDDPDIGIAWPVDLHEAILSDKDRNQPQFASLSVI